ncbi:MAG: hypothetical protein SLRJCFUN_002288 [Candidatus Fervidibacter sp.]
MRQEIPKPLAVLIIIAVVVVIAAIGLWFLNRPAPTITGGTPQTLKPAIPGQPQQGQGGQQPAPTPTY